MLYSAPIQINSFKEVFIPRASELAKTFGSGILATTDRPDELPPPCNTPVSTVECISGAAAILRAAAVNKSLPDGAEPVEPVFGDYVDKR